ncbi:phage gp6-like head-tail connector protein [Staphylococcus hominis]|uniref:phage gp6-like head-tail connector protein n=1 Tax=Staphylococcus TaxID=1279 RepID=UPI0025576D12|nr:phage gp6-like head-tail connector protein [Staphylococcus hominis]MDK7928849.1 phage gp6-like head-tail connector protein [Staphylococcus hominis]MDS3883822.1 phage gp6-like head-tail connector protein [Staphylococcus hominis]MDS3883884.1 phage gp6-like head-tail connector protein [Staphylococcus hominis]
MITQNHVEEMKRRLKIFHTFEDAHLKSLLEQSYEDIKHRCQEFDMDKDIRGAELVYERTRYAYNDSLEFFHDNFLGQITSFALENMKEVDYEQEL